VNTGNGSEQQPDVDWLNANCPPLVPEFNPDTGNGRTWKAFALGFLGIMSKDPCGYAEQGVASHVPRMNHLIVFDGNKWREIRNSRFYGLNPIPPYSFPPESSMQLGGAGGSSNFGLGVGKHKFVLKIITDYVLLYMESIDPDTGATSYDHAAIPRIYKGGFNQISWGVGPGCELDPTPNPDGTYKCKTGGTPPQCLTYSTTTSGYKRTMLDSTSMFDGMLVYETDEGACCKPDGVCDIAPERSTCVNTWHGQFAGPGTVCEGRLCCPVPFANSDAASGDTDVDQMDFSVFQLCYGLTPIPDNCKCFDRGGTSNVVDDNDFGEFQKCWTGPNVPFDPNNLPLGCNPNSPF
jgi:hypothetical protein